MNTELYITSLFGSPALKAYYRFSETGGTAVADSSGNANTGTASRANILNNVGGKFGKKAVFAAASSDNIAITASATLKPTTAFTVGAWFNTTTAGATQTILGTYIRTVTPVRSGFYLSVTTANTVNFISAKNSGDVGGTDFGSVTSDSTYTDGAWHLAVGTWDTQNLNLYVDATSKSGAWANAPVYAATIYSRIGSRFDPTEKYFFDGSLDDVFLLNGKALNAIEVSQLYNGMLANRGNIAGYFEM